MKSRLNLDTILRANTYNHAVLCTYTFDPIFFENYCLETYDSISQTANISVLVDQRTYNAIVSAPAESQARLANIRYLIHPVTLAGCFHPKLYIFTNAKRGCLILGSANLTRAGITTNAEMVSVFYFEVGKNEEYISLFESTISFLLDVAKRWPCETLHSNLDELVRATPWIKSNNHNNSISPVLLKHNLNKPLLSQAFDFLEEPLVSVYSLSRYFDNVPSILDEIYSHSNNNCQVTIYTQNNLTTMTKDWFKHSSVKNNKTKFKMCEYYDEKHPQPLHAKALIIQSKNREVFIYGSANFTTPALLRECSNGNLETSIFVCGKRHDNKSVDLLFDPCQKGYWLKDPNKLITASKTDDSFIAPSELKLLRVELDDNRLLIRLSAALNIKIRNMTATLDFVFDNSNTELLCEKDRSEVEFIAEFPQNLIQLADRAATRVRLTVISTDGLKLESNIVYIVNIRDFDTGNNLRRSRQFKEAQENTGQFLTIFGHLCEQETEESLLHFLNYCNIAVIETVHPSVPGHHGNFINDFGMRKLGSRNLIFYEKVHEAAIAFIERHYKRLQYHINYGTLRGVPNFFHIYLSIMTVIRSQTERALIGLSQSSQPIDSACWSRFRENMEAYFVRLGNGTALTCDEYLKTLLPRDKKKSISQNIQEQFKYIEDNMKCALTYRERLDTIIQKGLSIKIDTFRDVPAKYHNSFLSDKLWSNFTYKMRIHFNHFKEISQKSE